jgi:lipid-A-disaccharide synthase
MARVARELHERIPDLRIVLVHRDPRREARIRELVRDAGADPCVEVAVGDLAPWLHGARAVLAKSGTGSLEACLSGAPTVVVYAVRGALGRWMRRHLLTVPFFASANLCMNRAVVPEVAVETDADWDVARDRLVELLQDGPARDRCLRDLAALKLRLGPPGASDRAAAWVVPFCPAGTT